MTYAYSDLLKNARDCIKRYFNETSKVIIHTNPLYRISATIDGKDIKFYIKNQSMVELSGVVDIDDDYYGVGYKSVLEKDNVDYWVYLIRDEFHIIKTAELRKKVLEKEYDHKGREPSKAGVDKEYFLVKEEKFKSWCDKMGNRDQDNER